MTTPRRLSDWLGIGVALTFVLAGVALLPIVDGNPVDVRLLAASPVLGAIGAGAWWGVTYLARFDLPIRRRKLDDDEGPKL